MASGCVYDCVHPLWGGEGYCRIDSTCSCDPGYASKDFFGHPSCVLTSVLWGFYLFGAVSGAAITMFLVWHIRRYFHTPVAARSTRKSTLRLWILAAACTSTAGISLSFTILVSLGGNINPWDTYILSTIYTLIVPVLMLQYPMVVEYWLHTLPSQFLPPDSFTSRLRERALRQGVFIRASLLLGLVTAAFGAMTYLRSRFALQVATCLTAVGSDVPAIATGIVAAQITIFINRCEARTGDVGGFYRKAKRNIYTQILVFATIATANTVSVVMLFFVHAGMSTPILPMCLHAICGLTTCVPFAHFTSFGARENNEQSPRPLPASSGGLRVLSPKYALVTASPGRKGLGGNNVQATPPGQRTNGGGNPDKNSAATASIGSYGSSKAAPGAVPPARGRGGRVVPTTE
ncbi:unnamed protein product [Scytosiphon promiscuus]